MSTIDQPAHAGARRLRATLALAACLALCVIAPAPARADPIAPAAAGNVPGAALLLTSDAWLGAAAADAYDLELQLAKGGAAQGGIAGYSITTDGSDPDDTVEAPAAASHPFKATYRLPPLPEGAVTVRALTISKHGDRAATITSALLRVDRTPPDFPPVTPLDPATWLRAPVAFTVTARDPPSGSGMTPVPVLEPDVTKGAYVEYRIDGAPPVRVRGASAAIAVEGDGVHTVTYRARDLAGNPSPERSISFRIDRTPPETVAFEGVDPADPRRIVAAVADSTSGVAGGTIEYRPSGAPDWRAFPTALEGGRLVTYLANDAELPDGRYELRIRARDAAGNERVSDRRLDTGTRFELAFPLRLPTLIELATLRTLPLPGGGEGRLTPRPAPRSAGVFGQLRGIDGSPLTGTPLVVSVVAGPGAGAAPAALLTDSTGRFGYAPPFGPARTLRFSYAGSPRSKPASVDLAVSFPARTAIAGRARRTGAGRRLSLALAGRLEGGAVPATGKLLQLQVRVGRGWRTVARARTDGAGAWRRRVRLPASVARRGALWARALIPAEGGYPFDAGLSDELALALRG